MIQIFMAIFSIALTTASFASGTSTDQMQASNPTAPQPTVSLYDQGIAASKSNDDQKALSLFEEALKSDPNNPDIINMLAHSQRKTGAIDEAIVNYKKALEIKPNFPEAHEYLGKAYVDAALKEAQTLKGNGAQGQENLEDLTKYIKEAGDKA